MKSNSVTYTIAELNAHAALAKDARIDVTSVPAYSGGTTSHNYMRPNMMVVTNSTGVAIEVAILGNADEETLFNTSPALFKGIPIASGAPTFILNPCPQVYKVVVTAPSGTATANLVIWFGGHG